MTPSTRLHLSERHRGLLLITGLLLLALAGPATAGRHVISSLPYTFNAGMHSGDAVDTLVLGSSRLNASGSGISLAADYGAVLHGVLLDLGDDTISYGEGGGDGACGVRTSGSSSYMPYNIEIRGGYVLHGTPNSNADGCQALYVRGHDITVRNVTATVRGNNGQVYLSNGASVYNNEIDGGRFTSYVTGYDSRCNYDACVVEVSNLYTTTLESTGADYHIYIHDLTIADGPHVGIAILGREGGDHKAVARIESNNITTDARNTFYPSNDGLCHSSSNPYGITCRNSGAGTRITNNTITSGTDWGGNRGILIEYGAGTSTNPIIIRNNYVDVHEGPNVEYGDGLPAHGLRIRYSPRDIQVENNTFIGTGDADPGTDHYGSQVHTIRITNNSSAANIHIRNNDIRAVSLSSSSSMSVNAITLDAIDYDSTVWLEHNRIRSSGTVYKIGDYNGGARGNVIIGDTISFDGTLVNPRTFHVGHLGNNWDCSNNVSEDIVYEGGTADSDIEMAHAGTLELSLQRILSVVVRGSNNQPVSSATVTVTNNYGRTVLTGVTGSNGTVTGPVTYFYASRTSDSSNFNNFTVRARRGSDSAITSLNVSASSPSPVLVLPGTSGTPDTIPPGVIEDLGAEPGVEDGTIDLSWTAPGDDGSVGTVASYTIRYSPAQITEGNWSSTEMYANSPPPLGAGSDQTLTMSGLEPGIVFYVAIQATDSAGNPSPISNVISAEAKITVAAGDDDIPELASPADDSVLGSSQPTLIVANVNNDLNNVYYFQVSSDPIFVPIEAISPPIPQESGYTTAWRVDVRLEADLPHYWRVRVNTNPYSEPRSFLVSPRTYAYPNPFVLSAASQVSFVEVAQGARLILTTVAGDIVRHWINDSGNEIIWDGTNESGNPISSGTYLWYVEDTDIRGKLIVVR